MKKITYNFITGLKELSKKYNFDGCLCVDLSPSSFKLYPNAEFYIHTKVEDLTATILVNLRKDMQELLSKTKYPVDSAYEFSISSDDGTYYHLFDDSYKPSKENRQSDEIEFPCDNTKEEQDYMLSFDNGELILKKDHDDKENYFEENPKVIYFLNSFIDNKIPNSTTNVTFTKDEYDTIKWMALLAEEKILELAPNTATPSSIIKLKEQKDKITKIVRKVNELTRLGGE